VAENGEVVIGVDPGSDKCGLAAVRAGGEIIHRSIVPCAELAAKLLKLRAECGAETVVVGDRTGSAPIARAVREACPEARVEMVDEHNSTMRARDLYWRHNPPSALARLIPQSFRVPPGPIDDYAAAVLALDWLDGHL
jgi:RNase H-fold protein (predicted Holliday junction resolvase)